MRSPDAVTGKNILYESDLYTIRAVMGRTVRAAGGQHCGVFLTLYESESLAESVAATLQARAIAAAMQTRPVLHTAVAPV
jgi:hypothetical protein